MSVNVPRETTWDILRTTRNQAAIATLVEGMRAKNGDLRHRCLQILAGRNEDAGLRAIICHWKHFDEEDKKAIGSFSNRLTDTCSAMLDSGTLEEKSAALSTVGELDLEKSMDALLNLVLDRRHALSAQATKCLLECCQKWGAMARAGKDVPSKRGIMLEKLYAKIVLFHEHKNSKIIDAWLRLAHWDDSAQRGLISDPRMDAYQVVMKRLSESNDPAALQLLGGYIGRTTTPPRIFDILASRIDADLAFSIAKHSDSGSLHPILKHLKELPTLACLSNFEGRINRSHEEIEHRLWVIAASSSKDLALVLRGAIKLSLAGTPEARKSAGEVLRHVRCTDLDTLVPAMQEAVVAPDDKLSTGNLLFEVAEWVDSPSHALRAAARYMFRDFTLANLLEQVRIWPSQLCRAMALVVKRIEPGAAQELIQQLQSPAPKRRLAALQATELLGCVDEVSGALLPLLDDPRLEVRVRTIDLLSALGFEPLEQMIPELLNDASTDIQDAANRAIRRKYRGQQDFALESTDDK